MRIEMQCCRDMVVVRSRDRGGGQESVGLEYGKGKVMLYYPHEQGN